MFAGKTNQKEDSIPMNPEFSKT